MYSVHVKLLSKKHCHFHLRAVEAFKEVGSKLIQQLVAIYRLSKTSFNCKNPCLRIYTLHVVNFHHFRVDFAMFGYSPQKYLNIA